MNFWSNSLGFKLLMCLSRQFLRNSMIVSSILSFCRLPGKAHGSQPDYRPVRRLYLVNERKQSNLFFSGKINILM